MGSRHTANPNPFFTNPMAIQKSEIRIMILGILIVGFLGLIVSKLWVVQISRGEEYTNKIRSSSEVTVRIPSVRGEIRDRNGIPLVQNRASYQVDFYLPDVVAGYRKVMDDIPKFQYEGSPGGFKKDLEEADVVKIVQEGIMARLDELGLASDFNADRLRTHYRAQTHVPYTYAQDLDFETMARYAEHDLGLPGVDLSVRPVRHYVYGALGAHLLGYVGSVISIPDEPDYGEYNFYQPDQVGRANVERAMDTWLRGEPGARILRRNAKGTIEGEIGLKPPKPGANVYLSIDVRVQYVVEQALRAAGRAAAVVVDPKNGDVLAMASVPSYDPNKFIPSISTADWTSLTDDDTDPLLNRAISPYAPGSTYKIPIALAGLRAGLSPNPSGAYHCSGGVTFGNTFMRCWIHGKGSHGSISLDNAIKVSCNAYFYQFGNAAKIDQILAVGEMLGLGRSWDTPLSGEQPGVLPGPTWLQATYPRERWTQGTTANTSIGQGYVLASPLQMAMVTAAVANGGTSYYPRLIDRVVDQDGNVVFQDPPRVRANLLQSGLTEEQIEIVRRGMWKVVNEGGGTGRAAQVKGVAVAGKTGTAQNWRVNNGVKEKDNHVWFIAFAPYQNPEVAVCVFVQGANSGGSVAAPIAAKIIEETLAIRRGFQPDLKPLEAAPGSFKFVQAVNFNSAVPTEFGADPETADLVGPVGGSTSGGSDASIPVRRAQASAPDVRPAADAQGRVRSGGERSNFLQRLLGDTPQPSRPTRRGGPRR